MQARLLSRETGDHSPDDLSKSVNADLLRSFAPAPQHRFNGEIASQTHLEETEERARSVRAHGAGVSGLALEKFDGRILVSGGSEGSIKIWDLDEAPTPNQRHVFRPVSTIARSTGVKKVNGHSHGITHLAFYPFDPDAFLSSSYDKSLKLWATQRSALTADFHLNATIYSHAMSPIADHLLVSCATQHSNVRLVDLKSGSAVQALVAHGGPVLCTSWSPRHEHILASGHADGKVRIWDIRRAGGVIAQLDQEDSLGVLHRFRHATALDQDWSSMPHFRTSAQAHDEAVNGLQWTDDAKYIVSAGLDRKIRVWDAGTGANTLASFGALIQNRHAKTATMVVTSSGLSNNKEILIWPNDQEILLLDLHDGNVITRLRSPGSTNPVGPRGGELGRNRTTTIVWRGAGGGPGQIGTVMGGGNSVGAIYSAHLDGQIRAWMPQIPGPDDIDETEDIDEDEETRRRKRKAVDNAYRSLMGRQITFTGTSR
ncbi:WD40 domain protein [Metarhizium robertsii]|uniref:DNA excision repair protein ERCC-8 n=2 Tax=Metarhizium robertsii TaxID=568076 RepID=E9ESG6_METRA|nr:DNA excision repair protein ERCC-8 [Metarhizium robertsii ARSEF 23]EFZ01683.1 DNA excision repair protein ERCC-8 [Metarhizium robertsii ARSEF 23]EXU96088.1 WD40 domain protein [Metarhizium robertsii]